MTATSKVTRTICTLNQGGIGGAKLVHILHDRLVYAMIHQSEVSTLLTRPFLPLEPIVLGILESKSNYGISLCILICLRLRYVYICICALILVLIL